MDNLNPIGPSNHSAKVPMKTRINAWDIAPMSNAFSGANDASLFSSSLPVLWHEKLNFMESERGARFMDDTSSKMKNLSDNVEDNISADDVNHLLPDDEDELLAGIMDDLGLNGLPSQLEEYDLFGSVGGLEMDSDPTENITVGLAKSSISDGYLGNGIAQYSLANGSGTIAGEHPYGEHPSRTLFVRNINSNVEDSELRLLFEQYGDIRSLYTACKHRGFVMISYYDIRSARSAMRSLQNKPLRRRKLDIHFSIPKDNPSDKDMNQGTLVIFNLDPSVTNDDLRQIFGAYGEVKEIRETPHKRHHKFIEFYDVRAAEAALKSLNKSDIAGKRIKLEPSRPGGTRRNLMQQVSHEFEPDESRVYLHHVGSPIANSPPGTWLQFGSPSDSSPLQALSKSPTGVAIGPIGSNHSPDLASGVSPIASSMKISPIGKDQNRLNHADQPLSGSSLSHASAFQTSFSDRGNGFMPSSPGNLATLGASPTNASAIGTLSGPQFLWGSPTTYGEHSQSSSWQSRVTGYPYKTNGQGQGLGQNFPYASPRGSIAGSSSNQHHYHVGSAPSSFTFEKRYGYFSGSPETSFMNQVALANVGSGARNGINLMMNMSPQSTMHAGLVTGNMANNNLLNLRMMSSQRPGPSFLGSAPYTGLASFGMDGFYDRTRNRRVDNYGSQLDNKQQYQLDLEKITKGEDKRTTLMIKNIPNKYTSNMLLAAIDEHHKGTYDFLYLPIDFKNKCNVGYAFINMVSPSHIISFYEVFNGKKWEKFNSEKVASLAYARIQGRPALIAHFQNSSLMNEDKRCRPILFDAEGSETIEQDVFPFNDLNSDIHEQNGFSFEDDLSGSPERSNPTE